MKYVIVEKSRKPGSKDLKPRKKKFTSGVSEWEDSYGRRKTPRQYKLTPTGINKWRGEGATWFYDKKLGKKISIPDD